MIKQYIFVVLSVFAPYLAFSQEEATFSIAFYDVPVSEVLIELEETFDVRFSYRDDDIDDKRVTLEPGERTLRETLDEMEALLDVSFQFLNQRYISVGRQISVLREIQKLDNVIVNGYVSRGVSKFKDGTYEVLPKRLDILPGLTEADVLESLQLLPGVVSPNETATGLIVRGGRSDQNRVTWDGMNTYHKGHLFGMISPFNPNSTRKVTFHNKGTHPRFGERISSVIEIESSSEIANRVRAGLGLNAINADAYVEVPILKDQLSVHLAGRRSFTEVYESFTFDELANKVFQTTKIADAENTTNDFFFLDYNAKVIYKPDAINTFSLSALYVDNNLDNLLDQMDSPQAFNDVLNSRNESYGVTWNTTWNDRIRQETMAYFSRYRFFYQFITLEDGEQVREFQKRNVIFDSALTSEIEMTLPDASDLSLGYQYGLKDVSYSFEDDGDLDFILDRDQTVASTHAIFGNYSSDNFSWFDYNVGLRINYYQELDAIRFEPRIVLNRKAFKNVTVQVTGEIKNQIISEIDETVLSDLSLENRLWRLADGETFPIINSWQVTAGILYDHKGWSLDIDNYYKKVDGITALSLGFLNPDDSDFHIGEQNIYGIDFYVKKDLKQFRSWLNYSFSNVKNRFAGLNNNQTFTASNNIQHAITATLAFQSRQFQVAMAWHWRTGKPYTRAIMPFNDAGIIFQGINTERLPNYHRLDISSTYDFYFSRNNNLKGKVGFSIRNVYDQNNQLSREYTGNNNLNDPVRVIDKFSLGFTPNFLFRVLF